MQNGSTVSPLRAREGNWDLNVIRGCAAQSCKTTKKWCKRLSMALDLVVWHAPRPLSRPADFHSHTYLCCSFPTRATCGVGCAGCWRGERSHPQPGRSQSSARFVRWWRGRLTRNLLSTHAPPFPHALRPANPPLSLPSSCSAWSCKFAGRGARVLSARLRIVVCVHPAKQGLRAKRHFFFCFVDPSLVLCEPLHGPLEPVTRHGLRGSL